MTPILSIITVTKDDPEGLRLTLRSLVPLLKLPIEWEWIVVDSSPDVSRPVYEEAGSLPLTHFVQDPVGIYSAMNFGIMNAQGQFVWFLNGGDRLFDAKVLASILERLQKDPSIDACVGGVELSRGGLSLYRQLPQDPWFRALVGTNRVCHQAIIYRRASHLKCGDYDSKWRIAADYEHHLRGMFSGWKVETTERTFVEYDMSGASANTGKALEEARAIEKTFGSRFTFSERLRNRCVWNWERFRIALFKMVKSSGIGPLVLTFWIAWRRSREGAVNQETVFLFGVPISRFGMEEALRAADRRLAEGKGGYVCFANVHTLTESLRNPALFESLRGAFLTVADGVPLLWLARLLGRAVSSRVCGPDFMTEFLRRNPRDSFGFIGGSPGQAEALASRFEVTAVCLTPPVREFSENHVREDLAEFRRRSEAALGKLPARIWVGLGAPKQELWIHAASELEPGVLFFGVGAAFDFLSETKQRAPAWMRARGLEWLFRLSTEPGRLWRRYLVTNSIFVLCLPLALLGKRTGKNS